MKILTNKAQCLNCGDIVESTHRHDFSRCKCGAVAVDGGRDYLKRSGEWELMKDLSTYAEYEDIDEEVYIYFCTCMENNSNDTHLATVETASNFGESDEYVENIVTKFKGEDYAT